MNQLIPDLSYLHNDNSCTDFGDGHSLLRCRPEAMPHSLTTKMSMLTQRRLCRPNSYMESINYRMVINEATLVLEQAPTFGSTKVYIKNSNFKKLRMGTKLTFL